MFKLMKLLFIVVLLILIWITSKRQEYFFDGPTNFSQTTYSKPVHFDFSKRDPPPSGDYTIPKGLNELTCESVCPMNRRSNYDFPDPDSGDSVEAFQPALGPFYTVNGVKLENPDIEQLKYLDRVHNVPDITGTIQSKGSPFKGPRPEDMSEPSKYAGKSPNGLRDEIKYSNLYANDTMPKNVPTIHSKGIMKLTDHILAEPQSKIPDYTMNLYPIQKMTNTLG